MGEAFDRWGIAHWDEFKDRPDEIARISELQINFFKDVLSPRQEQGEG
jgi:hypothetical protein